MLGKVLVTDYVHKSLINGLEQMGYEVDYDHTINYQSVKQVLGDYVGVVINSKVKMDALTIDLGYQLEWIARLGSGLEIIDLPYAAARGISVYNSPEGNRNAVAEHAVGMLLCLQNQILSGDKDVRTLSWNRESRRGRELMGKTIGIIGLGNTGTALATKLRSWDMRILAHDPYVQHPHASTTGVEMVSLAYLQAQADIISLHVPLTPLTREIINADFLSKCKHGVILINTSRGKVVDIGDLVSSIERQKIGGLCLDVFPNEKTETFTQEELEMYNRLYSREDVVLTPHVAGWTQESLLRIAEVLLWKIQSGNS